MQFMPGCLRVQLWWASKTGGQLGDIKNILEYGQQEKLKWIVVFMIGLKVYQKTSNLRSCLISLNKKVLWKIQTDLKFIYLTK